MNSTPGAPVSPTRPMDWTLWMALALSACAIVWSAVLERTRYEYTAAIRDAEKQNSNLALALEEHTIRSLDSVSQTLTVMSRAYLRDGGRVDVATVFDADTQPDTMIVNAGIADAAGHVVSSRGTVAPDASNDPNLALPHRDDPASALLIRAPSISAASGDWVMVMSKRIEGTDGTLRGVAFVTVNPRYFTQFYRRADLGRQGLIVLVGLDGIVRARRVGEVETFGQDMRTSALMAAQARQPVGTLDTAGIDAIERIYSYRTLTGYPMLVSVATSPDDVLAGFQGRRRYYYTGAMAGTALILLGTGAILHFQTRQRRAMLDLSRQRTVLSTVQETLLDALLLVDDNARIVSVNDKFIDLWGVPEAMVRAGDDTALLKFVADQVQDREAFHAKVRYLYQHQQETSHDVFDTADGRTIDRYSAPVIGADGVHYGRVWLFRDITRRRRQEEQLRLSAQAFESIADGVIITDATRHIVSANRSYCAMSGYEPDELIGRRPRVFQSGRHDAAFYDELWSSMDAHGHWRGEMWSRRNNGDLFPEMVSISAVKDQSGATTHYVGVVTDISEVKRYEEQLEHQARHDALTGLPNRLLFEDRFRASLILAQRSSTRTAVIFIDLDKFKDVNDTLGHAAGDALLQEWSTRLSGMVRKSDTVARFGGDEFAVLLEGVTRADAEAIARKTLEAAARPFEISGHRLFVSASIGISLSPDDGRDAETLLKNADAALYQAKADGRNDLRFFSADMHARAFENLVLANALRRGLDRDELEVRYQPCVDLVSGRITSVEALAAWRHPELGLLPPGRFIPLAEETGLIEAIGERVLDIACRHMRGWLAEGRPLSRVAVNLSARQFRLSDLPQRIAAVLAAHGLQGEHLELEVTESLMMQNPEAARGLLMKLKSLGIRIAVDDFGTGYSSLSYLKSLPIDCLKIDKSFVSGVPRAADDVAIIRAIIAMAKSLGHRLIAEGVETVEQRDFLTAQGCDAAQGWLFGKPVTPADMTALLAADSPGASES